MDSRPETYKHKSHVQKFLNRAIKELLHRGEVHDQSKLESPEVEIFDQYTPLLSGSTYGSDEYKKFLAEMKPALTHHYAQDQNSHHPEHFPNGIRGMNLVDLLEMLADWKSSTLRHNNGNIKFSIDANQNRFGFSDELRQILLNTLEIFERE